MAAIMVLRWCWWTTRHGCGGPPTVFPTCHIDRQGFGPQPGWGMLVETVHVFNFIIWQMLKDAGHIIYIIGSYIKRRSKPESLWKTAQQKMQCHRTLGISRHFILWSIEACEMAPHASTCSIYQCFINCIILYSLGFFRCLAFCFLILQRAHKQGFPDRPKNGFDLFRFLFLLHAPCPPKSIRKRCKRPSQGCRSDTFRLLCCSCSLLCMAVGTVICHPGARIAQGLSRIILQFSAAGAMLGGSLASLSWQAQYPWRLHDVILAGADFARTVQSLPQNLRSRSYHSSTWPHCHESSCTAPTYSATRRICLMRDRT